MIKDPDKMSERELRLEVKRLRNACKELRAICEQLETSLKNIYKEAKLLRGQLPRNG